MVHIDIGAIGSATALTGSDGCQASLGLSQRVPCATDRASGGLDLNGALATSMVCGTRLAGGHMPIYLFTRHASLPARRRRRRAVPATRPTPKPGTASRRRRAVMQNTADRRLRGAIRARPTSPATLLIAYWSNRSPARRRLQQNRPARGGVGDATWSTDCVTRRRAPIQSLHERLHSLMPRAEAQYSFDGSGVPRTVNGTGHTGLCAPYR